MSRPQPRDRWATAALFAWLAASALAAAAHAQPPEAHKRVLVLYWYHKDFPLNVSLERSFPWRRTRRRGPG